MPVALKMEGSLSDTNELKVFVDLASISAGENDMDVDRVACFHDAVLGYSSMLYELKPDSGFHVFQEVVKKLWKALENDVNLPKKLVRHCHIEVAHLIFAWGCCQQAEMFIGGFSSLAVHRSPFGVAEDCQRQSWVGGTLFSLSSFSY